MKFLFACVLVLALAAYSNAVVRKSKATHNFFCNQILNAQIKKEFDASQVYLSIANHFAHDSEALHGFAKMFYHNWKEELEHGEKFMEYVVKRGGNVCTPNVDRPINDTNWSKMSVCGIIDLAISLEKEVSDHLLKVHSCASGEAPEVSDQEKCSLSTCQTDCPKSEYGAEDPHLQDFLEGEFLTEQVDGIKQLADLHTRLQRVGCQTIGLHLIDKELSEKYK